MPTFVECIIIGGTIFLLGGAVASLLVGGAISIYLKLRFGLLEVRRFETYARHEAPPFYWVARRWSLRLVIIGFALTFLEIAFMLLMFGCFYDAESAENNAGPNTSQGFDR